MADSLHSVAAFSGFAGAGAGRGVIATDRDGTGLATLAVRKDQTAALARCVQDRFGIALPTGPRRAAAGAYAFAGTGPGLWLASQESGGNAFAAQLAHDTAGMASVADQSDGYALLRLTGPMLRPALAKLVPLDLHPAAFVPGDVASTVASHIGITIWRLEDSNASAVVEVAVFRSLAGSFWHALAEAAAEFGLVWA